MKQGINTLDDIHVKGKTVLCRVDIDEPLHRKTGAMLSTSRLEACAPTLRELSQNGARVVILAHQGSDLNYGDYAGTAPHAAALTGILGREVTFADDVCGPAARQAIQSLADGDLLMLDNVRYLAEELNLFEEHVGLTQERQADTLLVRKLAPLADLYVCDAFGSAHHSQPSLCGFPQRLPSAMGRLFERELSALGRLVERPRRPSVYLLGGSKIDLALQMIQAVLQTGVADRVLVGGIVGFTLLWADGYEIGAPTRHRIRELSGSRCVNEAAALLERHPDKIVLPTDCGYVRGGKRRETMLHAMPEDVLASDIGAGTAELFARIILEAGTAFANGPMGVFEQPETELGTRLVWDALGDTEAYTFLSGEDTITATQRYQKAEKVNYISTGGRAIIRFLAGRDLPAVRALRRGSQIC